MRLLAATNSNSHDIEPPPFTPPRGILMHDRKCAQNWSLIGFISITAKEERSPSAWT